MLTGTRTDIIYSKDSRGQIRSWQAEIDGDKWRTEAGLLNGQKVISGWTVCTGKNIGKVNEATPEAQASFEAFAEYNKKLSRDYRRSVAELDFVPISPMLAQDYKKQKDIKFPVYAQPKLDGIRALISKDGAFSREFKPHHNIEHILEELNIVFQHYPHWILDGELYNHDLKDDFNKITSIVRTQKATDEDKKLSKSSIQYHVYDIVNEYSFESRSVNGLDRLFADFEFNYVTKVETIKVYDKESLDRDYAGLLVLGYEGQMIRDPEAPYEAGKRSKSLLKRKEFISEEFELVDVLPGLGNWAGYGKKITFKLADGRIVGAGVKGDQKFTKNLLDNKGFYVGNPVTIKYFQLTPDGVPRFPIAVDFHKTKERQD